MTARANRRRTISRWDDQSDGDDSQALDDAGEAECLKTAK